MCTAVSFCPKDHYFGRNLDLECSYDEKITITPRKFPLRFRMAGEITVHHAMIGMAYVCDGYPLYYDATNEKGVSMAGLNFPDNAFYPDPIENAVNIAPFELIPWILSQCTSAEEAVRLIQSINLAKIHFSFSLPLSPLHWMLSDRSGSFVIESMQEGLKIYENPVGVLTNNPPFEYHRLHLANFMGLTSSLPANRFSNHLPLKPYSLGMGSIGLPGDFSSASRFVKAAFVKFNSRCNENELSCVSQFFHILGAVEQPRGCTMVRENEYELTLYSSCCNTDRGIYYYKTYDNSQITAVDLNEENLEGNDLICYPLQKEQQILKQNEKGTN